MNVVSLPIDTIDVGSRLRAVDQAYVAALADSIAHHGLRSPIEVREADGSGRYRLIAGAHRYAAVKLANLAQISAIVIASDEFDAEWREIEENLLRRELTKLDKGAFLARRQELFFAKYPARRKGVNQWSKAFPDLGNAPRFTEDVARLTPLSTSDIYVSIKRYRDLADVRHLLAGTRIADNGSELDALCRVPPGDRLPVAEIMVARGCSVSAARAVHEDKPVVPVDPRQRLLDGILTLWKQADAELQRDILRRLNQSRKKGDGA